MEAYYGARIFSKESGGMLPAPIFFKTLTAAKEWFVEHECAGEIVLYVVKPIGRVQAELKFNFEQAKGVLQNLERADDNSADIEAGAAGEQVAPDSGVRAGANGAAPAPGAD